MIRNTALAAGFCSQLDDVLIFKHVVKTTVQTCSLPSLCRLDSLVTCGPQAGGPGTRWLLWLFSLFITQLLDHVTLTRFWKLSKWIKRCKNSFIIGTADVINHEKKHGVGAATALLLSRVFCPHMWLSPWGMWPSSRTCRHWKELEH